MLINYTMKFVVHLRVRSVLSAFFSLLSAHAKNDRKIHNIIVKMKWLTHAFDANIQKWWNCSLKPDAKSAFFSLLFFGFPSSFFSKPFSVPVCGLKRSRKKTFSFACSFVSFSIGNLWWASCVHFSVGKRKDLSLSLSHSPNRERETKSIDG